MNLFGISSKFRKLFHNNFKRYTEWLRRILSPLNMFDKVTRLSCSSLNILRDRPYKVMIEKVKNFFNLRYNLSLGCYLNLEMKRVGNKLLRWSIGDRRHWWLDLVVDEAACKLPNILKKSNKKTNTYTKLFNNVSSFYERHLTSNNFWKN